MIQLSKFILVYTLIVISGSVASADSIASETPPESKDPTPRSIPAPVEEIHEDPLDESLMQDYDEFPAGAEIEIISCVKDRKTSECLFYDFADAAKNRTKLRAKFEDVYNALPPELKNKANYDKPSNLKGKKFSFTKPVRFY